MEWLFAINVLGALFLALTAVIFIFKRVFNPGMNTFLFLLAVSIPFLAVAPNKVPDLGGTWEWVMASIKLLLFSLFPLFYFSYKFLIGKRKISLPDIFLISFLALSLLYLAMNSVFGFSSSIVEILPFLFSSMKNGVFPPVDNLLFSIHHLVFCGATVALSRRLDRNSDRGNDERKIIAWLSRYLFTVLLFSVVLERIEPILDAQITPTLLACAILGFVAYLLVRSPSLLNGPSAKYRRSSLQPGEADIIHKRLEQFMVDRLIYRDPKLSLASLAAKVKTSLNGLSQVINQEKGMNFNRFINGYRLAEAEKLLAGTDQAIFDIALSVGFNSLSSFNTLFKQKNGISPSEYRSKSRVGS